MAYALPPPTQAHHHPYWDLEPTSFPPLVIAVSNAPKSAESPGSRRIGVIGALVYFLPSETVSYKVTLGIGILVPPGPNEIKIKGQKSSQPPLGSQI